MRRVGEFNYHAENEQLEPVMNFEPVRTKVDLDTLDSADIVEGYMSASRGDPEPGLNRGRAFWHGWRNRMIDLGQLPTDAASQQLVREYLAANRSSVLPSEGNNR